MADYSVALVTDPRIDYEAPRVLPARVGPNSFTAKKFEAPDPTSTSPTITVQCPSYNTGIGRVVFYHMKAKLTIAGTDLENWSPAPTASRCGPFLSTPPPRR